MEAKQTALENAMRKIEKDFGKGAIMRLGDVADKMNLEVISSGSWPSIWLWASAAILGDGSSKSMDLNRLVKRLLRCMPLHQPRKLAASRPSSMQNMP